MALEGTGERACDRCRERRVKCDKRHPSCLRCEKLGKPCPGYDKKRKFVDEGANLRRKYLGSIEGDEGEHSSPSAASERQEGLPTRPRKISASSANQRRPRSFQTQVASNANGSGLSPTTQNSSTSLAWASPDFTYTADSIVPDLSHKQARDAVFTAEPTTLPPVGPTNNSLSADAWDNPWFDPEYFDLEPSIYYGQGNNSCGFVPEAPSIVDEVDRGEFRHSIESVTDHIASIEAVGDVNLWAGETQLNTSQILSDEREHELAFLIRHFAEAVGPWMDLFDSDKHFGHLVPLKALQDTMLRNAIAAVAAKQLARVNGNKPFTGSQTQCPARMEIFSDNIEVDWFYKAANYYDKAIASSRLYLQALSGTLTNPSTPNSINALSMANTDDLMVAVSIFSMYEYLDNLEVGWMQHLAGMKSLLNVIGPCQEQPSTAATTVSLGHRASFWNFARADYQSAYLNRRLTLLDTEDLSMWRRCGLEIGSDGTLFADTIKIKSDPGHQKDVIELVTHTLLWILLKVVNYVAGEQNLDVQIRQSHWDQLVALLEQWESALPVTFKPCAQIRHPLRSSTTPGAKPSHIMELFFSMEVCAAAMQLYHFARMVLLLNKPVEQKPGGGSRLHAYREIAEQAMRHAREVCGIALARPQPAVRVEMLLPLFVAGSCFEDEGEQNLVAQLLRAIEKDTGCATEAKVLELQKTWGGDALQALAVL